MGAASAGRVRVLPALAWLAALAGLANLVVLAAQAASLVHSLYLNADNASALVMPALAGHLPAGAVVNLGNHAWYEPWWFMRATAGLPGYRQLWEAAPIVGGLLGSAAVAACAWWALGRVAGLACAAVLFAASEAQRWILYVPESHGLVVLHLAALCAALLFAAERSHAGRLSRGASVAVAAPLVLFTGAGLTDQLLLASALPALVLAPALCWWRTRADSWRSVSAFSLAVAVLSALLALLLTHVMQDRNVVHAPFPVDFVGSESIFAGIQNLIATLCSLGGGDFFGAPASGANLLTFLAGALTLLALAAVLAALWRWLRAPAGETRGAAGETGGAAGETGGPAGASGRASRVERGSARERAAVRRDLFVAFWGLVLVVVLAVFALTSVSGSTTDGRYLLGAWAATAALLGAAAQTPVARAALLTGVALFGVLNIHAQLSSGVTPAGVGPGQRLAGAIERFASAEGASVGYASYWDSAPVSWETRLHVKLYPVGACATPAGLCPYFNNQISSWYRPRAGVRSFLLTDSRPTVPGAIAAPPASFGKPLAVDDVGEGLTVYVYGHDVAADLG